MKKNKSLRAAAILLALTLITTSIISGTFANYVTKGEGNGTARTAKWGIKIAVTGDELFDNQYTGTDNAVTVSSQANPVDKVVAPGTQTKEGKGLHIVVNGTAETSFSLAVSMTGLQDVYLEKGKNYDDYTKFKEENGSLVPDGTFTFSDADYYPVKYTLTDRKTNTKVVDAGSLTQVQTTLNALTRNYAPGSSVDIDYMLTWAWEFNGTTNADGTFTLTLKKDTVLGAAANGASITGAHTTIAYTLSVTATQID